MADEKGWIFWYNQRWFDYSGTTLEQMAGWGWRKVHHPDHMQRVVDKVSKCFESGEVWEDTFPLRSRDGTYRWFLSRVVPIRDAEGKVLRWFGTNTDISESKKAEEELKTARDAAEAANQAKSEFLANMSHEICTPMNGVMSMAQLLLQTELTKKQRAYSERVLSSADALLTIINDILDFSKVEAGKMQLETIDFSLRAAVEEVADLLAEGSTFWFTARLGTVPKEQVAPPVRQSQLFDCLTTAMGSAIEVSPPAAQSFLKLITAHSLKEAASSRRARLLLAEDNETNQIAAVQILENFGYQVDVASNGREAVEACQKTDYEVVLMDNQMPLMDGFEATREIRKFEEANRKSRVPIIALTANAMQGDREKCEAAGMNDYLSKPFKIPQLSAMLDRWTRQPPSRPN